MPERILAAAVAVDNQAEAVDNQTGAVDIHHTAEAVDIAGYFLQEAGSHSPEAVPCLGSCDYTDLKRLS